MATRKSAHDQDRGQSQTLTKTRTRDKVKRPRLYKVLFHNDDYTPMEFVVLLLTQIFAHSETSATRIMLHVHNRGVGVAGIYPFSIAETKLNEVMEAAETSQYPLLCTTEPAGDGDDDDDGANP